MTIETGGRAIAGVDGCRTGWVVGKLLPSGTPEAATFPDFSAVLAALPTDTIIAVDMPIGLPDFVGEGGRGPERLVRPLIGARSSSVFSIPSRPAIHASAGPSDGWLDAHRRASDVARQTSDPARGVSIQAFGIFAKIRQVDALLIASPGLRSRVFESHPEVALWRLNGDRPLGTPKKVKGRINPAGMAERRAILAGGGLPAGFVESPPPRGAAADDFLDACAMLLVAARIARGEAVSFPDPPGLDAHGLPIAIWA